MAKFEDNVVEPALIDTMTTIKMQKSVHDNAVYYLGHRAVEMYMQQLAKHIRAVQLFAGYFYPEIVQQTLVHDASKYSEVEFEPYARYFFGYASGAPVNETTYDAAWEHHTRHNPHHWMFWQGINGHIEPMPQNYVLEMMADWHGAAYAYGGQWDCTGWLDASFGDAVEGMSPITRDRVEKQLFWLGYKKGKLGWELNLRSHR